MDQALLNRLMFCLNWRLPVAELVTNWCNKRGGAENKSNKYVTFWQQFKKCGECSLLLTLLSTLQRIERHCWHCPNSSPISRCCELLTKIGLSISRARWHSWSLLVAAALSVSISGALLATTQWASLLAPFCYCSSTAGTSCILSKFGTWRVLVCKRQVLTAYWIFHFRWTNFVLSVSRHWRALYAFLAFLRAYFSLLAFPWHLLRFWSSRLAYHT